MSILQKKIFKLLLFLPLIAVMAFPLNLSAASNTDEMPYTSYTYWNTDDKMIAAGNEMYQLDKCLTSYEIGIGKFNTLNDICIGDDGRIYLLDGGASRVVILNSDYSLYKSISSVNYHGNDLTFKDAKGIFVRNGYMYIADSENNRVLKVNSDEVCEQSFTLPDSSLIPSDYIYKPIKVTVDSRGYTYILSEGSYYGALLFSPNNEFLGFYGANVVKTDILGFVKNIWTKITSTNAKRSKTASKLPYQFTDMYCDSADFIYTATGRTGKTQIGQIKRLSPGGLNILDSDDVVFGDLKIGYTSGKMMTQNIAGLAVDKDGYIYCYDVSYGRIYVYDNQCNLLTVIGGGAGVGDQQGTFEYISAIDISAGGDKIYVIDEHKLTVTVFKRTEYGSLVNSAQTLTLSGDYAESESLWTEVMRQDKNSQLAYIGLAKAAIIREDYTSAMKYAELGSDKESYSEAFEYARSEYLNNNFTLIAIVFLAAVGVIIALAVYAKKRKKVLIGNKEVKLLLNTASHPAETFGYVKTNGLGSVALASIVVLLFYISLILKETSSGFIFRSTGRSSFNSFVTLMQTVGAVLLFTGVNWAVSTLMGGKGKLREIYIVTAYSIVPMVVANFIYLLLSKAMTESEGAFLAIFMVLAELYTGFILIVGIITIHDFTFGSFIKSTLLTLIGILIIVFLIIVIFILLQQFVGFLLTVITELFIR